MPLSSEVAGTKGAGSLKKAFKKAVKSIVLCALVMPMPQLALAAETTINTAETTTQGPTGGPTSPELDGGDTLTIGESGSVTVAGDGVDGIIATGGSNTITNSGSISTAGEDSYGILAFDDSNTITNSGIDQYFRIT